MNKIFLLLILFQFKHFLADYPLQGKYMLGKFKSEGWLAPLAAHCGVHAAFTFAISVFFVAPWIALWLALLDWTWHLAMDRIKASSKMLGRYKALSGNEMQAIFATSDGWGKNPNADELRLLKSNTYFWWSLGLDQMVHHLTHYYIIFNILINRN